MPDISRQIRTLQTSAIRTNPDTPLKGCPGVRVGLSGFWLVRGVWRLEAPSMGLAHNYRVCGIQTNSFSLAIRSFAWRPSSARLNAFCLASWLSPGRWL